LVPERLITIELLTASTMYQLEEVEPSNATPAFVREVESFVLVSAPRRVQLGEASMLLARFDGIAVGAAVHAASRFVGAQYLQALMIDHRWRGQGIGRALLAQSVQDAHIRSSRQFVFWQVHRDNAVMLHISATLADGGKPDHLNDEFAVFVHSEE
jgi:GNAT superfamily N-acetyltransferase